MKIFNLVILARIILCFNLLLIHYSSICISFQQTPLEQHTQRISSLVISSDNKFIVTGSWDGTAIIWNVNTKDFIKLIGHKEFITDVSISYDNSLIATTSADGTAIIWNAYTGEKLHILRGHYDFVTCAAFSKDGNTLVTGSYDKVAIVWDTATGQIKNKLENHLDAVQKIVISNKHNSIISIADKVAYIWNMQTGLLKYKLESHEKEISDIAISSDERFIVTGSYDKTAKVWDIVPGKLKNTLTGHVYGISTLSISPNDKFIITGSANNIYVWDFKTGEIKYDLRDEGISLVYVLAASSDNNFVITGSFDTALRLWDLNNGRLIDRIYSHKQFITGVAISPDNSFFASCSKDSKLIIYKTL
ncbi:WD40 repeat domain-containing protein [Candidatus Babela massiliensis]|uniref:WD40 repeat containing protein n=1 Tax=Candidatus Babela massiliensis TaxID=673862 RepID=V6DGS3_9BACT|nr:WD40 repeat domain-containing protein [Candidatus Babela massiliensis]CDK30749.1 WD40 repeat containing protein [Candidatus Babela massiliensis]